MNSTVSARRQRLAILGSTGSVGANTLDVAQRHPESIEVVGLSAFKRMDELAAQCERFREEKRKNKLQVIVSNEEGTEHCWINQNAKLSLGYFESGKKLDYHFNPTNKAVFVFNIDNALNVNGVALQHRDGIGIWDTDTIDIHCTEESRFLIIEVPINH